MKVRYLYRYQPGGCTVRVLVLVLYSNSNYSTNRGKRSRGGESVNPSDKMLGFLEYLLSQASQLCSVEALGRFQSQVFFRAEWKLESSNDLWQHFLNLVCDLCGEVLQKGGTADQVKIATSVQAICMQARGMKLGIQDDELKMRKVRVLTNLRYMLGLLINKFLSFYAGRILKELDLRPKKATSQREAARTEISAMSARKNTKKTADASDQRAPEEQADRQQQQTEQPLQENERQLQEHGEEAGIQDEAEVEETDTAKEDEQDAREEELFMKLLDMNLDSLKAMAREAGFPLVDAEDPTDCVAGTPSHSQ